MSRHAVTSTSASASGRTSAGHYHGEVARRIGSAPNGRHGPLACGTPWKGACALVEWVTRGRLARRIARSTASLRAPLALGIAALALFYAAFNLYVYGPFVDTGAYWLPWSQPIYNPGIALWLPHFVYSPVAALVLRPFGLLPYPVFAAGWTALGIATYAWLLWPLPAVPRVVALLAGFALALNGNVEWGLALMVVLGMRRPPVWLLAAFTKVTPFLGFGWFVLLRDWRAVAQTALVGGALAAVSALVLPGEWVTWAHMLVAFSGQAGWAGVLVPPVPLAPRVVVAVALLAWGALRRQPLVLPLVLIATQPDLQPWAFGYLAAVPRLSAARVTAAGDRIAVRTAPGDPAADDLRSRGHAAFRSRGVGQAPRPERRINGRRASTCLWVLRVHPRLRPPPVHPQPSEQLRELPPELRP